MKTGNADDLVLGAATGYALEDLLPFVLSLKKTGYAGRICLFVWDLEPKAMVVLRRLGVELYPCSVSQSDKIYTVTGGRFFVFQDFLKGLAGDGGRVMLTDVRDVVFQRNPFDAIEAPGVHVFFEHDAYSLGREAFNAAAIVRAYGPDVLDTLAGKPIACVGVVIGDQPSILAYLERITAELGAMAEDFFGSDQAAHNRIVHENAVENCLAHGNDAGPVLHMALVGPAAVRVNGDGCVVRANGEVIPVLHQYDRHPALQKNLLRKYL